MKAIDKAWGLLEREAARIAKISLTKLFSDDEDRFDRLSFNCCGLLVDHSKEHIDQPCLKALVGLAQAADLEKHRDQMFAGFPINFTENLAALHMALREGISPETSVNGQNILEITGSELNRFLAFAEDVRRGRATAVNGRRFTDVINIGIGGADLGPRMTTSALSHFHDGPHLHYVSNIDTAHFYDVSYSLDPQTTLVIIASKTFMTLETSSNAQTARNWLVSAIGENASAHLAAVSANLTATQEFGIDPARTFKFWDWVGGRYSLWSAIGLPLAIAIGAKNFRALLSGAAAMDQHFTTAELGKNLPVLMALIGIWRRNLENMQTLAIIPYDQRLVRFPAYLQQLEMESNGKSVSTTGHAVDHATSPIIWGEPGTNAQHSFFQLLHQGSDTVPVDFLIAATQPNEAGDHHLKLAANCFAQSQALAFGLNEKVVREQMAADGTETEFIDQIAPHRAFAGNRPSTTILYPRLDPETLGKLIVLYEHKVFCQGIIWQINSFDQWGVELGKHIADRLLPTLSQKDMPQEEDTSTKGLVAAFQLLRQPLV